MRSVCDAVGQPSATATTAGMGKSAPIAMGAFGHMVRKNFHQFFHNFFGASLDKLPAMFQVTANGVLALASDECQTLLTDFLGGDYRHEIQASS
jgi:hypothetical protein